MKAAVFREAGKPLAIETLDDPRPRDGDVIIRVDRCGICSSDLHMTSGHAWDLPSGTVPGHEFAGEIVEVGKAVEGFRRGDIITGMPTVGCGHCPGCAHGVWTHCETLESIMGGYGEYMRIPAKAALRLPASLSLADGALVEPFAVGLFALRTAGIIPGDRILVLGAGPIALATIFWAKHFGAGRVAALARSQRRAGLALAMSADAFIQTGDDDVHTVVEALGGRPQVVFECVGAPGILAKAIDLVGLFGHVASMGFCVSPDELIPATASMKGVRLTFPIGYALRDFEYVADTMLAGRIDPKMIISNVIALDDLPNTFEALRGPNAETKVQVSMRGR